MAKLTDKQKVEIYERVLMRINFHRTISLNENAVHAILREIDKWALAHSTSNGELTEQDVKKNVDAAINNLLAAT